MTVQQYRTTVIARCTACKYLVIHIEYSRDLFVDNCICALSFLNDFANAMPCTILNRSIMRNPVCQLDLYASSVTKNKKGANAHV